jgi:hypothetical protein
MSATARPDQSEVPLSSLIFGYGPMAPLLAAALAVWSLKAPWAAAVASLAVIWGAMILVFIAGVRRGYGFGDPSASPSREIATMLVYFSLAGGALVCARFGAPTAAPAPLIAGFVLAAAFDRRGALSGDAPRHFARLRGPQMTIAALALAAVLVRLLMGLDGR